MTKDLKRHLESKTTQELIEWQTELSNTAANCIDAMHLIGKDLARRRTERDTVQTRLIELYRKKSNALGEVLNQVEQSMEGYKEEANEKVFISISSFLLKSSYPLTCYVAGIA